MFEKLQTDALLKLKDNLGNLIKNVKPENSNDWDAFKKMVSAHDQLRTIDHAKLSQMSLIKDEKQAEKAEKEAKKEGG